MKKLLLVAFVVGTAVGARAIGTAEIQGKTYAVDTLQCYNVGPGVKHVHLYFSGGTRKFHAYVMDMDRSASPLVHAKVDIGNDSCQNAERITAIAKRKSNAAQQYLAGVNGDFFITSAFAAQHPLGNGILGYPNMTCVTEGKLAAPDMIDITSRENALIIDRGGYMYIDATDLKYSLLYADGVTPLAQANAVNYPRLDNQLMVYNSFMGKYTHTTDNGREITLTLLPGETWAMNRPVKFVVNGEWHNGGNSAIPGNGIVVSVGPDYHNSALECLSEGDVICLQTGCSLPAFNNITPDITEICGGDVRILNSNKVTTEAIRWINTPSAAYSRSMVGYSQDRNHLVLCAVDGSIPTSDGVSYYEGADVMRYLGCYDALDLDGGGSTAIWEHKNGIVNNLRDGSERAVGNGIFFVLDAPVDNQVASLQFAMPSISLPQYGLYIPTIYGYNKYGQLVDTDVRDFILSAPRDLGYITENGTALMADGNGCHALTVTKDGMTASIPVTIDNSTPCTAHLSNVLLDNITPWSIQLESIVAGKTLAVSPMAFSWVSDNEAVATVDSNGVVTGISDGKATITGRIDNNEIAINVTVECPKAAQMPVLTAADTEGWTIAGIGVKSGSGTVSPAADGIVDIAFNVSSTRGHNLQASKDMRMYSRPDAITLKLDANGVSIKEIGFDIQVRDGRSSRQGVTPAVDADGIYSATLALDAVADITGVDAFPMTIKTIFVTPTTPARGDFVYTIKDLTANYKDYTDGIETVAATPALQKLDVTVDGNIASIPYVAQTLTLADLSGRTIATRINAASITMPDTHGVYIVRAMVNSKMLTTKVVR